MNKFIKHRKIAFAVIFALAMIMSMAVTVFADSEGGEELVSYFSDPLFLEFIFLVIAFLSIIICSILIYHAVKNRRDSEEYEEEDGSCKIYEDLEESEWEAPSHTYVDAVEPTAVILTDLEPVKPVEGLDGFVITETPISSAESVQIGSDPYAFKKSEEVSNYIYEAVPYTVLTDDLLLTHTNSAQPINIADDSHSSPFTYIAAYDTPAFMPEQPAAFVLQDNVKRVVLEDEPVAAPPTSTARVTESFATSNVNAVSFVQDIPITIYTSGDDDGVVHISATIVENEVASVQLVDGDDADAPTQEKITPTIRADIFETNVSVPEVVEAVGEDHVPESLWGDGEVEVNEDIDAIVTHQAEPVLRTEVDEQVFTMPVVEPVVLEENEDANDAVDETVKSSEPIEHKAVVIERFAKADKADPSHVGDDYVPEEKVSVEYQVENEMVPAETRAEDSLDVQVVESAPVEEIEHVEADVTSVLTANEAPVVDITANFVEAPMPDLTILEDTPVFEEYPEIKEVPVLKVVPAIPSVPVPAAIPESKEESETDEVAVSNEIPVVDQTPAFEEAPAIEQIPVIEEAPVIEQTPVIEEAPMIEVVPVAEEAPVVEQAAPVEEVLVIEETPIVEDVPAIAVIPLVEEFTITDEQPVAKQRASISTIPTTVNGRVKHEDPMISRLPHVAAKGLGSNAASAPFVLPATEYGRKIMATYTTGDVAEPSFKNAVRQAKDIPIAPMIDLENRKQGAEQPASAHNATPTPDMPSESDVFVANTEVDIRWDGDDALNHENLPEIVDTSLSEPVQESVEQPAAEETAVEEPAVETAEDSLVEAPAEEVAIEPVEESAVDVEEIEPSMEEDVSPTEEQPISEDTIDALEEETLETPEIEESAEEEADELAEEPSPIAEPVFTDAVLADELMTDAEAAEHIETVEPTKQRKGKMHAINLDTLCDSFDDGETVTLEALKAKKLAPAACGRVKILARGTMTKKLDIVADNFSLQAVKMITLAGGRAEQFK